MSSLAERRFLPELSFMKAICIFAVIWVHATSVAVVTYEVDTAGYFIINLVNRFFKFGTPVFIMLSAFTYFFAYWQRPASTIDWKRYFKTRVLYILLPYLLFSVFYYIVKRNIYPTGNDLLWECWTFVVQLFTGKCYPHLYFVIVVAQFYILFPFLFRLMQKFPFLMRWAIPIGIAIEWGFYLLNHEYIWITQKGSLFISYSSYYLLGAWVGANYPVIRDRFAQPFRGAMGWITTGILIFACATMTFYVMSWYWFRTSSIKVSTLTLEFAYNFYILPMGILLFLLCIQLSKVENPTFNRILTTLGSRSFGIYLIHPFLLIIYRWMPPVDNSPFWYAIWIIGSYLVAMIGSYLLVGLIVKTIKIYPYIIGNVRGQS